MAHPGTREASPFVRRYTVSNLSRMLGRSMMTDEAGLVPGSAQWLPYWKERTDRILRGDNQ
jgi:hypothetical protein